MALNTLANITQNEIEYARLCNEIKSQLDWRTGLVHARKEGLDEGRIEGIAEASFDIARKMKNAGRPLSEIMAFTGLSIETISHLN